MFLIYRFKPSLALLSCKQWLNIRAFVFLVITSQKDVCISHRLKLIFYQIQ